VLVANSTYVGFYINTSGIAESPIMFKALENSVTIDQPNAMTNDGINVEGGNWVVIDGHRRVSCY
jgi:hypothetical protein